MSAAPPLPSNIFRFRHCRICCPHRPSAPDGFVVSPVRWNPPLIRAWPCGPRPRDIGRSPALLAIGPPCCTIPDRGICIPGCSKSHCPVVLYAFNQRSGPGPQIFTLTGPGAVDTGASVCVRWSGSRKMPARSVALGTGCFHRGGGCIHPRGKSHQTHFRSLFALVKVLFSGAYAGICRAVYGRSPDPYFTEIGSPYYSHSKHVLCGNSSPHRTASVNCVRTYLARVDRAHREEPESRAEEYATQSGRLCRTTGRTVSKAYLNRSQTIISLGTPSSQRNNANHAKTMPAH